MGGELFGGGGGEPGLRLGLDLSVDLIGYVCTDSVVTVSDPSLGGRVAGERRGFGER